MWFIIGNVWYYDAKDCDEFEEGESLMLLILILYWIVFSFLICIFAFGICRGFVGGLQRRKSVDKAQEKIKGIYTRVNNLLEDESELPE